MALNKRFNDIRKVYDKLGYNNADCLFQAMGKSADYYYIGFLTQSGTDVPTARTFYNDFLQENSFSLTYEGVGKYRIYCNLFNEANTEVEVTEGQTNLNGNSHIQVTVASGYVELSVLDLGALSDDVLFNTPVKIKVWKNAGTTAVSECLFYYAPDVNVDLWTIDGVLVDDPVSVNGVLNSYGIFYEYYIVSNLAEPRFVMNYVGAGAPAYVPVILDSNGNPVTWSWNSCCTKVCITQTYGSTFFSNVIMGYFSSNIICSATFDDFGMIAFVRGLFGQQTGYTYIDNGDGTFDVTIDNAFVCSPVSWSADNSTYIQMVNCS